MSGARRIGNKTCNPNGIYRQDRHEPSSGQAAESRAETTVGGPPPKDRYSRRPKMAPGARMSPNPNLEGDRRVLRYRYNKETARYEVTKYDPKQIRFGENGVALTGPTVKIRNVEQPLSIVIPLCGKHVDAKLGSLARIEDVPHGTGKLFTAGHTMPVHVDLLKAKVLLRTAQRELDGGRPESAQKLFHQAQSYLDRAGGRMKRAISKIEKNVERTVTVLDALKTAGEVAEVGLLFSGVGSAMRFGHAAVTSGLRSAATKAAARHLAHAAVEHAAIEGFKHAAHKVLGSD